MRNRSICAVLFAFVVLVMSSTLFGQVRVSVTFAPPALPVYEQPVCPGDGYIWTPGYWAWDDADGDYYWVPGTWVMAPEAGFLWTPPYWGWDAGAFLFHEGYWGPHVGFYGGISYGFGYFGDGFQGGRWDNGHFFYNRSVTNVNVTNIHNVYNTTVINQTTVNRVSYNGGNGGVTARPTAQDEAAAHERHVPPPAAQAQHVQAARSNPELRASANKGKPPVAATAKPGDFKGREVVPAREAGGTYTRPAKAAPATAEKGGHPGTAEPAKEAAGERPAEPKTGNAAGENGNHPAAAVHPKDLPPAEHAAAPNTGNANLDKKYQQQQQKLEQAQGKDRQKLQQQQEKEHQQLAKQNANDARKQQTEQKHQQQTEQMQQRHTAQQQKLQQKQAPPTHATSHPPAEPQKGKQ